MCSVDFERHSAQSKSFSVKPGDRKSTLVGEQVHFNLDLDSYYFFYCENLILEANLMYFAQEKFGQIAVHKD